MFSGRLVLDPASRWALLCPAASGPLVIDRPLAGIPACSAALTGYRAQSTDPLGRRRNQPAGSQRDCATGRTATLDAGQARREPAGPTQAPFTESGDDAATVVNEDMGGAPGKEIAATLQGSRDTASSTRTRGRDRAGTGEVGAGLPARSRALLRTMALHHRSGQPVM